MTQIVIFFPWQLRMPCISLDATDCFRRPLENSLQSFAKQLSNSSPGTNVRIVSKCSYSAIFKFSFFSNGVKNRYNKVGDSRYDQSSKGWNSHRNHDDRSPSRTT